MDYKYLNTLLMNEFADVVTYATLAKDSEGVESQILRDIAREEFVHAKHLKNILKESGELMEGYQTVEDNATKALESV